MSALIPALAGALAVAGIIAICLGLRPRPPAPAVPGPKRTSALAVALASSTPATRALAVAGVAAGALVAITTGWLVAAVIIPAAALGLPVLLSAPPSATRIDKLEALEEWTRSLSAVLTVGVGLEQALIATLRSTPPAIRVEVSALAARLRSRTPTRVALRAFADDLDDATGDLVAANLLLGVSRRGPGLASVLDALSESVATDVRARRAVEADRAKPRTTARAVSAITLLALALLALSGSYIAPYSTPVGQVVLIMLLAAFAGALIWMRRMATGAPPPRFIGATLAEVRR